MAPMGPLVDEQLRTWLLRPYRTSCTFQNLQLRPYCTFHIIDDVLPVVRLILGHDAGLLMDYHDCGAWVLRDACRWFHLEVTQQNCSQLRTELSCRLIDQQELRAHGGWNRAQHSILEIAILVTRTHLTGISPICEQMRELQTIVDKTGGSREVEAWELLRTFVTQYRESENLE